MMEGQSFSAAPAERSSYYSNPELVEECIKLQNIVDKMVCDRLMNRNVRFCHERQFHEWFIRRTHLNCDWNFLAFSTVVG